MSCGWRSRSAACGSRTTRCRPGGSPSGGQSGGRTSGRIGPTSPRADAVSFPSSARCRGWPGFLGRNVQVNPYSVLACARILDEGIPGHVTQGDERIGADAKLILHDAYTLDATANPDFSQVETNDPQVT